MSASTVFNLKHQPVRISASGRMLGGRAKAVVPSLDDAVLAAALKRGDVVVLSDETDSTKPSTPAPTSLIPEPAHAAAPEEVAVEEPAPEEKVEESVEAGEEVAAPEIKKRSTKAKEN